MKQILFLIFCFAGNLLFAQTDLEAFLKSVESNSLKLKSFKEWTDTRKLEAKTGLTPANPEVEFEYLPGNITDKGTMTTMKVSQKIEFPTVYAQKNKLSKLQQTQSDQEYLAERMNVLSQASALYLHRVYLQKYRQLYANRLTNAETLLRLFEQKLANGDANILEVNKLKLELTQARKQASLIEAQQEKNNQQLKLVNAGQQFVFGSGEYPLFPETTAEELVQLYREKDPELRIFAGDVDVAFQKIKLRQNESLPELAFSYGYEKTPDVKYAGPGAALTIPLWQHKNKVKQARSNWEFSQAKLSEETLSRETDIREKASQLIILKASLAEMRQTMSSINSAELLGKALNTGEISLISFLTELQFFFQTQEELLALEQDYYLLLADLNRVRW
jgi:outer membrane protein TolC